jgi:cytoskeletal protein CcmA (bactofilin family)
MIWKKKIKAGALQFVLFIGAIIAVSLMSFVLISHTHILFKKKTDVTIALIRAVDQGLAYSFTKSIQNGDVLQVPDREETGINTTVHKKYWGLLERRTALSKKGKLEFEKTGFVGHGQDEIFALFLKENQRPMVIAGDAKITGTVQLPERGIKMGNIQGYGYTRPQLVYGKQQRSSSALPKLEKEVIQQLERISNPYFEPGGVNVDLKKGTVLKNSFKEETKTIKGLTIDLEKATLSGNIMVWASRKITVHSSAELHDVVLVAPHIEIKEGVRGNFQAVASEQIRVGKRANLDYPSVLAVHQPKNTSKEMGGSRIPNILLENSASVAGIVLYMGKEEPKDVRPHIKIEQNALVVGEVHCSRNLELKGSIYGSATTDAFIALENGNAYLNHLFNGKLDATMLPLGYGGICYEDKPANTILKWLY